MLTVCIRNNNRNNSSDNHNGNTNNNHNKFQLLGTRRKGKTLT